MEGKLFSEIEQFLRKFVSPYFVLVSCFVAAGTQSLVVKEVMQW